MWLLVSVRVRVFSDCAAFSGLAGLNLEELGIPTEEEYVAWYTKGRGLAYSSIMYWDFYLGLSFFRVAAIMQGVYARSLTGMSPLPPLFFFFFFFFVVVVNDALL